MSKIRVRISFRDYKDAELEQKAQHIVQSLTGNAAFPNPTPALADVQTAISKYAAALANAIDGSKQDTAIKKQSRDDLEGLLHDLALYVQLTGKDDAAVILSSGFDIAKTPTPVGVLPKPDGFSVNPSASKGSVDLYVNASNGAKSYQYEYTDSPVTPTGVWHVITDTATAITVNNLQSGKEYAFRVAGIGSDPTRVYSDVVTSFVL